MPCALNDEILIHWLINFKWWWPRSLMKHNSVFTQVINADAHNCLISAKTVYNEMFHTLINICCRCYEVHNCGERYSFRCCSPSVLGSLFRMCHGGVLQRQWKTCFDHLWRFVQTGQFLALPANKRQIETNVHVNDENFELSRRNIKWLTFKSLIMCKHVY